MSERDAAGRGASAIPALNKWLRNSFRIGVSASFGLMLLGLALYFWAGHGYEPFAAGKAIRAIPWAGLPAELSAGQPLAFLSAGVIMLLVTPVAGLFASAVVLATQKEPAMVAVTLAVLAILATSVALAR